MTRHPRGRPVVPDPASPLSREVAELIEHRRSGGLNRRQLLRGAAALGLSMPALGAVLTSCGAPAQEAAAAVTAAYPYGQEPIASSVEEAVQWWMSQTEDAVDWQAPEVVLTSAEIEELKGRAPRVAHQWYSLSVPAIAGWNEFWLEEVQKWAPRPIVYDVQSDVGRDIRGAQALVGSQVEVAGTLAVNWNLFGAAMRKYQAANIPTTSVVAPSSAYYPATCTVMPDQVQSARELALPMAKILARNGLDKSDVVFIPLSQPAYFDIAREIGLKEGVESAQTKAVAQMTFRRASPAGSASEVEAAVTQVLNSNPDAHVIAVLSHAYVGAAAAVRSSGRRDVWVIAFDLDQGTASQLLNGGWPVAVTYSLPTQQLGAANANVMGKILLGKEVPLIVKAMGTATTKENVAEAYAHDWGGRALPWN